MFENFRKYKKFNFLCCIMYKLYNSYCVMFWNFVNFVILGFWDSYIYIYIYYTCRSLTRSRTSDQSRPRRLESEQSNVERMLYSSAARISSVVFHSDAKLHWRDACRDHDRPETRVVRWLWPHHYSWQPLLRFGRWRLPVLGMPCAPAIPFVSIISNVFSVFV